MRLVSRQEKQARFQSCEDTRRKRLAVNQEDGLHQNSITQVPRSGTSSLENGVKSISTV